MATNKNVLVFNQ